MRLRRSELVHEPTGTRIETPLLIPSFSSKGFAGPGDTSQVGQILQAASELVTEACLISAYDMAYKHLPAPHELPIKPDLTVIDSGGYEISGEYDLSEVFRYPVRKRKWGVGELITVLDKWPAERPAVFVSYDHPEERKPLDDQIAAARKLFREHGKGQMHCFLLKQEKREHTSLKQALSAAMAKADDFAAFHVFGITEKGLGASPLDRMVAIARLRRALDEAGRRIPIHVFGSLDPVSICLYTIAGAEIFDGLTWLRYAFTDDHECVYPHSYATLHHGLATKDTAQRLLLMSTNYYYLLKLQGKLRHFVDSMDFGLLPRPRSHPKFLKEAYSQLKGRMSKHE